MKMIKKVIALALLLTLFSPVYAGRNHPEKWYQTKWCLEQNGEIEVTLSDHTRCDCITGTHAVEMDFANKWYQAVGQSLHYALQTNKRAGILLIIESPKDRKYLERLNRVIRHNNLRIDVWTTGDGVDGYK